MKANELKALELIKNQHRSIIFTTKTSCYLEMEQLLQIKQYPNAFFCFTTEFFSSFSEYFDDFDCFVVLHLKLNEFEKALIRRIQQVHRNKKIVTFSL